MSQESQSTDKEIQPLREEINQIDAQIVELLDKRAKNARNIGEIKGKTDSPVYRPERENEVILMAVNHSDGTLKPEGISSIFKEIMSACRSLEKKTTVAFLGPRGTFSEMAMFKQFGRSIQGIACEQIEEVFRAVEAGTSQFGIVPMENSTEGSVNRTLDALLRTSLSIISEVSVPVHHNLLTKSGTLEGITRIYSHPQSLGQCVGWLNSNVPDLPRMSASSNGEAAKKASEDPTIAAIAGETAAEAFGLKPVFEHIQDDAGNRTRFVVLAKQGTEPSKAPVKDKTSLIISVPHKAGAIYHALKPLDYHNVSMTKFESRPARSGTWEYYFYIDIEGHCKSPDIIRALDDLKDECAFFKNLGSYPVEQDFGPKHNTGAKL